MKLQQTGLTSKMKKSTRYFTLFLLLAPFVTGCRLAYRVILGVDSTPEWETEKAITQQAKRYGIPDDYSLVMDTAVYFQKLNSIYSNLSPELQISGKDSSGYFKLKKALKDDAQPTQFRLFDKNGTEIFKIVNCYIDPPVPMNWNVNGCFDHFPPRLDIESLNAHHYNLDFLLSISGRMNKEKITLSDLPDADYYGVILWNDFLQRPSGKLIKTVKDYIKRSGQSVHLIYINNHNAYLWQLMDAENREKVKKFYSETQEE